MELHHGYEAELDILKKVYSNCYRVGKSFDISNKAADFSLNSSVSINNWIKAKENNNKMTLEFADVYSRTWAKVNSNMIDIWWCLEFFFSLNIKTIVLLNKPSY